MSHGAGSEVRTGVFGTGAMGAHHVRLLREMPEADLVGVFDTDPAVGQSVAETFDCPRFSSFEALAGSIDAAVVAAPTSAHRDLGTELLRRGVHVLVEKPLAGTLEEADELLAAAGDSVLAVGHVEYHNPAVESVLSLGLRPGFVEVHRLGVFSPRSLDIDVVLDLMIHDLQILHGLDASPIVGLHAVGINVLSSRVDIANVRLELESGCVANLTASRVSAEKTRKFRVFSSTGGYYAVDYSEQRVRGYRLEGGGERKEIVGVDLDVERREPLKRELEGFLAACRGEADARVVTGEQGRRALASALRVVEDMARRKARGPVLQGLAPRDASQPGGEDV